VPIIGGSGVGDIIAVSETGVITNAGPFVPQTLSSSIIQQFGPPTTGPTIAGPAPAQAPSTVPTISCIFASGFFNTVQGDADASYRGGNGIVPTNSQIPWSRGKNGQQFGFGNAAGEAGMGAAALLTEGANSILSCLARNSHQ
jgi:hypothetical protein